MSIFIRKNLSYPPMVFLSETLYFELPKNLVICFKGTLASLLLDTTKSSNNCLFLLNLKQGISPKLIKLQISESHSNPPKAICKRPKSSAVIRNHPPKGIYNHPEPSVTARGRPRSAGIYLGLAVTFLGASISVWRRPQWFMGDLRPALVFISGGGGAGGC